MPLTCLLTCLLSILITGESKTIHSNEVIQTAGGGSSNSKSERKEVEEASHRVHGSISVVGVGGDHALALQPTSVACSQLPPIAEESRAMPSLSGDNGSVRSALL